jgi:WD40 repeat protein
MADITLDTKRAISDISWSINNPNELVVAFSFQSLLYVYDLEEPEHPSRVLESGKDSSSGGGYKVVINIEKTVTKNGVDVKKEMIIAGTSYGYIRMWDGRNDKRPVWDFQADSQAALKGSPVVSIIPISNMTNLVSVTESGIISVWDLNNLTVAAFMSEAKPSCRATVSSA